MLEEIIHSLSALTCSTDSIRAAASALSDFLLSAPNEHFNFVCAWLKSMEAHPNKIALLYLANELLQTTRGNSLSNCFEQVLPDAFRLMGESKLVLAEMRRVLIVWRHRKVFSEEFVGMLAKICEGLENGVRLESGNMSQLTRLAMLMDQLEQFKSVKPSCEGTDLHTLEQKEKSTREEYILELGRTIKRLNVQLTNHCIYLQQLNFKCDELQESALVG